MHKQKQHKHCKEKYFFKINYLTDKKLFSILKILIIIIFKMLQKSNIQMES